MPSYAVPILSNLKIVCSPAKSGVSQKGWVYLSEPATSGGISVTLASNTGYFTVPSSVIVAEGADSASFTISTSTAHPTTGTISAQLDSNTFYADLTTTTLNNDTFCIAPYKHSGGNSQRFTGYVHLDSNAGTGGEEVDLTSGNTAAPVPTSVSVPEGSNNTTFNIDLTAVTTESTGTITAHIRGQDYSTESSVIPPWLKEVTLNNSSIQGGSSTTGHVNLRTSAPTGGTTVNLTSDNSAATVPSSVTVAANGTTQTFTVNTTAVGSTTVATISAELNGITKTVTLTITP
jgi:hypothetical protein